jgi:hypothetical protein
MPSLGELARELTVTRLAAFHHWNPPRFQDMITRSMTTRTRAILITAAVVVFLGAGLAYEIVSTRPVREAVRAYSELISLGNRPALSEAERAELIAAASKLCSSRYLATRSLSLGPEGGIAGLPRMINKNFQAWREGENVWICPTNRIGPVYQFVQENGRWRFDGLVAILRPMGEIVRASDMPELDVD